MRIFLNGIFYKDLSQALRCYSEKIPRYEENLSSVKNITAKKSSVDPQKKGLTPYPCEFFTIRYDRGSFEGRIVVCAIFYKTEAMLDKLSAKGYNIIK